DNGLYRPRALIQCLILLSCSMRRPPPCYTFFPYTTLFRSMGALREFATAHNIEIQHCKPHGALFMQAMEDKKIARAILESVYDTNPDIIVFAVNNSVMMEEANQMGIQTAKEVYADREHTEDGSIILTRRSEIIEAINAMVLGVVRMIKEKKDTAFDGKQIVIEEETVCINGDTPNAPILAKAIVEELEQNNIRVKPISHII